MAALKNKECKLFIIGEGDLGKKLPEMIMALSLKDRVVLPGGRPHKEIAVWMNEADLLCLPSLTEGVPSVILEALSCGTPVVATNVGGIPEIINDENLGFLVPPGNEAALAEGIDKALDHHWNREHISNRVSGFSWDITASNIMGCLRACIK